MKTIVRIRIGRDVLKDALQTFFFGVVVAGLLIAMMVIA